MNDPKCRECGKQITLWNRTQRNRYYLAHGLFTPTICVNCLVQTDDFKQLTRDMRVLSYRRRG